MSSISKFLEDNLNAISQKIEAGWSKAASSHGWDPSVSSQVTASVDGFSIAPGAKDKVMSHEYGDIGVGGPKPAMRSYSGDIAKEVDKAENDAMNKAYRLAGLI